MKYINNFQLKIFNTILSIGVLMVLSMGACNKFLEKKSDDKLSVVKKLDDLQKLLDDTYIMNNATPSLGEISTDNYFMSEAFYNARPELDKNAYRWLKFDYNHPNDWASAYNAIFNSNLSIEISNKISKSNLNEATWNNVYGSALFYRAYYFLNLAWVFSPAYDESTYQKDLGIPLRLSSDFNDPSVRSSVKETYEQIISDAKKAVNYLPDYPRITSRPSKTAAYGLLARAYLSMREYDSSLKYSDLALSFNKSLLDYNIDIDPNSSTPFSRFNKETTFYTEFYIRITSFSMARNLVDTSLMESYNANDIRKTAFFKKLGNFNTFKGSYAEANRYFSGITNAEMYLIRSESFIRNNEIEKGLEDLNTLLSKRWKTGEFIPIAASNKEEALQVILLERRKELVFRGLRWIDIKRLNKEGFNIIPARLIGGTKYLIEPNSARYSLPLPTDIILQTGMQQN